MCFVGQPYILGSMRLLLWDCDDRTYSFYIETSVNQKDWVMVVDKRNEQARSWQNFAFTPIPVVFIRIVGTRNTANEIFHCVHLECPSQDPNFLLIEKEKQRSIEEKAAKDQQRKTNQLNDNQPTTSGSGSGSGSTSTSRITTPRRNSNLRSLPMPPVQMEEDILVQLDNVQPEDMS